MNSIGLILLRFNQFIIQDERKFLRFTRARIERIGDGLKLILQID